MQAPPRSLPIAVFDSGVGGLTVLHSCLVMLPNEDFVYLGDTGRFPYGTRTSGELERFALELGHRLLAEGAKLLVVACNAATAAALPALRRAFGDKLPVLGVVDPAVRLAAERTNSGRIGLLATPATVASGAYDRALAAVEPSVELTSVASRELAPLIESGGEVDARVVEQVEDYCAPLRSAGVDTVILGCTHYPLVAPLLQRSLGRGVELVASGPPLAEEVDRTLESEGLSHDPDRRGSYRFLCSGDVESFRALGTRFLQLPLGPVEHVAVGGAARARPAGAQVRDERTGRAVA